MRWRVAAVAALLVTLASCGVPDSGPPVAARAERGTSTQPEVNVVIPQPRPGGAPAETFNSFVAAGGVTQNRSKLAEVFVLSSARRALERSSGVGVVRLTEEPIVEVNSAGDQATVRVSGQRVGVVADSGVFSALDEPLSITVTLVRESDRWLFTTPPPYVLVRDVDFGRAFRPTVVYFAAAGGRFLVPERRYVDASVRTASLATPILRMLLSGPSPWLTPVTRVLAPPSVRLRGNVTVTDQEVVADFTPELESLPAEDLNLFAAQIGWSLRENFTGGLRLQVSGRPLSVAGVPSVQDRDDWMGYQPAELSLQPLYVVSEGAVRVFGSDTVPAFGGPAGADSVLSAAITLDRQAVALVRSGTAGMELWAGPAEQPRVTRVAGAFARPTWGQLFGLSAADGAMLAFNRAGDVIQLSAEGVPAGISALRLSYDNSRLTFVAAGQLYIALVRGDAAGVTVSDVRLLSTPFAQVRDVGWVDPTRLVVSGEDTDGAVVVWDVEIDGSVRQPAPRASWPAYGDGAVAAAATEPTAQPVFAVAGGQLWQRFADGWALAPELAEAGSPFYPG